MKNNKDEFYAKYAKRVLDIICSLVAMILLCWLYIVVAVLVRIKLGKPVIYKQKRPGKIDSKTGEEKIFTVYKFRSMTNDKDEDGKLLSDSIRLTSFGRFLRSSSLDELPEIWNIFKGDMSVVGPRPLAVIYLPYYTSEERKRHNTRPGLTGLAQVNGRNALTWEEKFRYDLKYIDLLTFKMDFNIVLATIKKVVKRSDIGQGEKAPLSLHIERKDKGHE